MHSTNRNREFPGNPGEHDDRFGRQKRQLLQDGLTEVFRRIGDRKCGRSLAEGGLEVVRQEEMLDARECHGSGSRLGIGRAEECPPLFVLFDWFKMSKRLFNV